MKQLQKTNQTKLSEQLTAAGVNLPDFTRQTINLYERRKIPEMEASELVERGGRLLKFLWNDLGLAGEPERYDVARWCDFLKNYFGDFSVDEVKVAFEMYMAGRLDQQFTQGNDRRPKHYGRWSIEFAAAILRAYRDYRGKVVTDVGRQIPRKARSVTAEEKAQILREFMLLLRDHLVRSIDEGAPWPAYWNTPFVHRHLCMVGLLDEAKVSRETITAAYEESLMSNRVSKWDKRQMREDFDAGKISDIVGSKAENIEVRKEIERLIEMTDRAEILKAFNQYESDADNRN